MKQYYFALSLLLFLVTACAAIICKRFPSVRQPPTLEKIDDFTHSHKQEDI